MTRWSGKGWAAFPPLCVVPWTLSVLSATALRLSLWPQVLTAGVWEHQALAPEEKPQHCDYTEQGHLLSACWKVRLATQHGEADHRGIYKRRERPDNSFLTVKHSTERLIKWVWVQWPLSWNELAFRSCCRVSRVQPKGEHKTLSPPQGGHRKGLQMGAWLKLPRLAWALLEKSTAEMNDIRYTIKYLNSEIWHVSHFF